MLVRRNWVKRTHKREDLHNAVQMLRGHLECGRRDRGMTPGQLHHPKKRMGGKKTGLKRKLDVREKTNGSFAYWQGRITESREGPRKNHNLSKAHRSLRLEKR